MIESILIKYLNDNGIRAYMEVPANASGRFVVLEKTGSNRENKLDRATIAVQSYDESLNSSASLNDMVKRLLLYIDDPRIVSSNLNSDYNYTNTATKQYRYQAVFDFYYYEEY